MKHTKTRRSTPPPRMPVDYRMPLNRKDYQYSREYPVWVTDKSSRKKYPMWVTDGPFYYNPDDPRLFVPWRGWWRESRAINFGHPRSWWVIGGIGVVLAGMALVAFFSWSPSLGVFIGCFYLVVWLLLVGNVYLLRRRTERRVR